MNAINQGMMAAGPSKVRGDARHVIRALPLLTTMVANTTGVEVVVGGTEAHTNGKRVTIPWIEPEDSTFESVIFGYLWHEIAHVKETDFGVLPLPGTLLHGVTNIFEDIRIEKKIAESYPGSTDRLASVSPWLMAKGMLALATEKDHPAAILQDYVLNKLRQEHLDEDCLQPIRMAAENALKAIFPAGAVLRLEALLSDVDDLKSTSDARTLAAAVIKMLSEEEEKERNKNDPSQESPDQSQQSADGQSAPAQAGGDQAGQDGSANGSGGGQNDQQSPSGKSGSGHAASQGSSPSQPGQNQAQGAGAGSGYADVLAQALAAGSGDLGQSDHAALVQQAINAQAQDQGVVLTSVPKESSGLTNAVLGRERFNKVRSLSNLVRAKLQGLVVAHRDQNVVSSRGRRMDTRRLVRLAVMDMNVFVRKQEREDVNTAFHLLVDTSGSMSDPGSNGQLKSETAQDAVMSLSIALEGIEGVSSAVTAFPGSGTAVMPLQRHDERIIRAAERFVVKPAGGTPMAEAMWYAALQLVTRPEPKRVLGVTTDGEPYDPEAVRSVVRRLQAAGIIPFGIGIGTSSVKNLFPLAIVINDVSELRNKLFEIAHGFLK